MSTNLLPEPDSAVIILLPTGDEVTGSVSDADDDTIELTLDPSAAKLVAEVDGMVLAQWGNSRGLMQVPANVRMDGVLAVLTMLDEINRTQRREFVRVPLAVPARLYTAGRPYDCDLLDVSEGGARLAFGRVVPGVRDGDRSRVVVDLPEATLIDQEVDIIRVIRNDPSRTEIAVRFVRLPEKVALPVRQFLVKRQIQLRAAAMKS